MHAVESPSSCCNWSCCTPEDGAPRRFSPHWKIIPGLLTLIANIVAIACATLYNTPYLCVLFVPSTLASLYLIYMAWEAQSLSTLSDNNAQLKQSIQSLQKEKEQLQSKISELQNALQELKSNLDTLQNKLKVFEEENKKLQESTKSLSTAAEQFKAENATLKATTHHLQDTNQSLQVTNEKLKKNNEDLTKSNQDLKSHLTSLEELKKTLEQKAAKHVEQLSLLEKSLTGLEAATEKDHAIFGAKLQDFVKQVKALKQVRQNFQQTGTVIEEKLKEQISILLKSTEMLQNIFLRINEWKNDKTVTERIKQQQLLNDSLRKLEAQVAEGKARNETQKQHLEELKKIKTGFDMALNVLLDEIGKLKEVKGSLAAETAKVARAAKAFQNYELKSGN